MFKVTRCERVDNPYYKALVENPCIRTVTEYHTEAEANAYINGDIDDYLVKAGDEVFVFGEKQFKAIFTEEEG